MWCVRVRRVRWRIRLFRRPDAYPARDRRLGSTDQRRRADLPETGQELKLIGSELIVLGPENFRCVPCPSYPEIGLAIPDQKHCTRLIEEARVDAVHIATEGPVGWMARAYCKRRRMPFTTSFHTRFADYVSARWPIPESWVYAIQRRFHRRSAGVMVATESFASDLRRRGFERLLPWTRGVDTKLFRPDAARLFGEGPVFLYAGRVAVERTSRHSSSSTCRASRSSWVTVRSSPSSRRAIRASSLPACA